MNARAETPLQRIHRAVWSTATCAGVIGGLVIAWQQQGWPVVVALVGVIAPCAAVVLWARDMEAPYAVPRALDAGLWTALAMMAVLGWSGVIGAGGLVGLAAVLLLSPWFWRVLLPRARALTWRERLRAVARLIEEPAPIADRRKQEASATHPARLRSMPTRELGRCWRQSTRALRQAQQERRASDLSALVLRRAEFLDELERRDPDGFRAWLRHATVASDPADWIRYAAPDSRS